jgi:hypothetical protein
MRARVAWAHDGMSDPTLAAAFQTLPGASFIVNGVTPAKNSALTPPVPSFASPTASRCWPNSTASSLPAPPRTRAPARFGTPGSRPRGRNTGLDPTRRAHVRGRIVDDSAPYRHGRVLRFRAGAAALEQSPRPPRSNAAQPLIRGTGKQQ